MTQPLVIPQHQRVQRLTVLVGAEQVSEAPGYDRAELVVEMCSGADFDCREVSIWNKEWRLRKSYIYGRAFQVALVSFRTQK
jgi:hypothetical protein